MKVLSLGILLSLSLVSFGFGTFTLEKGDSQSFSGCGGGSVEFSDSLGLKINKAKGCDKITIKYGNDKKSYDLYPGNTFYLSNKMKDAARDGHVIKVALTSTNSGQQVHFEVNPRLGNGSISSPKRVVGRPAVSGEKRIYSEESLPNCGGTMKVYIQDRQLVLRFEDFNNCQAIEVSGSISGRLYSKTYRTHSDPYEITLEKDATRAMPLDIKFSSYELTTYDTFRFSDEGIYSTGGRFELTHDDYRIEPQLESGSLY